MKNLIPFAVLFTALTFGSCQSNTSTPEGSAKAFLEAMMNVDFNEAKKYGNPAMKEFISSTMEKMTKAERDETKKKILLDNVKITTVKCVQDGDKATCTLSFNKEGRSEALDLVKENGQWLVDDL